MEEPVSFIPIPRKAEDLRGRQFSDLIVIGAVSKSPMRWLCKCACGNYTTAIAANLKNKGVQSCGCLRHKGGDFATSHGLSNTPEHRAWAALKNRCTNPSNKDWRNYGGRGISVDPLWLKFENFLADMGRRPSSKHTLDRRDPNGPYSKDNCRWATVDIQANNKRTNVYYEFRGERLSLAQLSRKVGVDVTTIRDRLSRNWSLEEAATTPPVRIENFANRLSKKD